MCFKESEILELKRSTSELKEALIAISAILNKHRRGELYFGIKNDGTVAGQMISDKTLRDIAKAIGDHIEPEIFPVIQNVNLRGKNVFMLHFMEMKHSITLMAELIPELAIQTVN
jgi:ATP-dependent DNA helicase RecG